MKGHAKLQLFDNNGKLIQETEKDNMITNALNYVIPAMIASNQTPNTGLLPLAYNALGGLMMFDGELEEDPDNIHYPNKNVHLVGYGGRYTDSSNIQRGSFNSSESGETDTGYVMVWDFNTSQANGTIRSIALTHRLTGTDPFYLYTRDLQVASLRTSDGTKNCLVRDAKNQLLYYIDRALDNTSSGFAVKSAYVPLNLFKVSDGAVGAKKYSGVIKRLAYYGIKHAYQYNTGTTSKPNWETRYLNITTGVYYKDGYDGYAYVAWTPGNSSGDGFFYLKRMKISDFSFEEEDQIRIDCPNCQLRGPNSNNTTGNSTGESGYGCVSNGYAYFMAWARHKVYRINLSNPVDIMEISIGDQFTIYDNGDRLVPMKTGGIRLMCNEAKGDGYNHYRLCFISEDGAYNIDQIDQGNDGYNFRYDQRSTTDDLLSLSHYYDGANAEVRIEGGYLGTICNLSTPVVKTAAASLKVIYTLTDYVEPDEPKEAEDSTGE
ncbi:MAG: hypothetical protein IJ225_10525 [Solobacterium sp.]|nr:hypothetical protein [Solobacterium sp.]